MNHTNRALNRALLLIIGVCLIGVGALGLSVATWPTASELWQNIGSDTDSWLREVLEATQIGASNATWIGIGGVAAIVLVLVLLILALTSLIRRRTKTVIHSDHTQTPLGRVTVTEAFVSDALRNALVDRDEILSVQVTANDIRTHPVLHVAVTPRQNTNPKALVDEIDELLTNLSALMGQRLDTYISVHSGLRARLAHDQLRLS